MQSGGNAAFFATAEAVLASVARTAPAVMIDRFQTLMPSGSAAAMDTFDFALRCDPMASRLTRRTGQDPGRPASRRAVTPGVAQDRTDHQLWLEDLHTICTASTSHLRLPGAELSCGLDPSGRE